MNDKNCKDTPDIGIDSGISDCIRQWMFPMEFRIAVPCLPPDAQVPADTEAQSSPVAQPEDQPLGQAEPPTSSQFIAEVATCLWYLKTKHFRRDWLDDSTDDDDPRVRRAMGRLNKGIGALKTAGIEVHDPTNSRYPTGAEAMMRPIQFQPTDGLTFKIVTETVIPIIYCNDRIIQRGEVFVAVPKEQVAAAPEADDAVASTQATGPDTTTKTAPSAPEPQPACLPTEAVPEPDEPIVTKDQETDGNATESKSVTGQSGAKQTPKRPPGAKTN